MAKQRSERFLAQVQKEYQVCSLRRGQVSLLPWVLICSIFHQQEKIAAQEKEMTALVEDEGRIAQDMESRFEEVKEVS